jgi:integrase
MTTRCADMIAAHLAYLAVDYSPRTARDAAEVLTRLDRQLPYGLDRACHQELIDWLTQTRWSHPHPPWSRSTRATYRKHIVRFYRWAVRDDDRWLDTDPSAGLPAVRVPHGVPSPASDRQVAAALALSAPWGLHCLLAAYAGMRPCEIAQLDRDDVGADNIAVVGKGDKPALIPTHPLVWETVRLLPAGPVTRRPDGRPATAYWVTQSTSRALRRAGIGITLRWLRHWYGTSLLAACHDLRVVQECMRHASVATTQVYTQVVDGQRRAAVGMLPDLTGPATDFIGEPGVSEKDDPADTA